MHNYLFQKPYGRIFKVENEVSVFTILHYFWIFSHTYIFVVNNNPITTVLPHLLPEHHYHHLRHLLARYQAHGLPPLRLLRISLAAHDAEYVGIMRYRAGGT